MERPPTAKESREESRLEPGRQTPSSSGAPPVPSNDMHNIMPDGKGNISTGSHAILTEEVMKGGFRTETIN